MLIVLLCILATIAVHRLWHYEDIFAPVRSMLGASPFINPNLTPLLIAPLIAAVSCVPGPLTLAGLAALACYPLLRSAVTLHEHLNPKPEGCSPCEENRKRMEGMQNNLRLYAKRVILLGADIPTTDMLARQHPDWAVVLTSLTGSTPKNAVKNVIGYQITQEQTLHNLLNLMMLSGNATIITYNIMHLGSWQTVIQNVGVLPAFAWVHITHADLSVPAHHRVIAPGEPLDMVLVTTQPLALSA